MVLAVARCSMDVEKLCSTQREKPCVSLPSLQEVTRRAQSNRCTDMMVR